MFVAIDGQPAGIIAVADPIKPTTPAALSHGRRLAPEGINRSLPTYAKLDVDRRAHRLVVADAAAVFGRSA